MSVKFRFERFFLSWAFMALLFALALDGVPWKFPASAKTWIRSLGARKGFSGGRPPQTLSCRSS